MNQSDIYHRQFEVYQYDLLEPEERLFVGRKPPREVPTWMLKTVAPRVQLTEREQEEREDEFLRKHGIV